MSISVAVPPDSTAPAQDTLRLAADAAAQRLAADAAARELRALDALLASSDGAGPPVCAAVLRAWYAVASLERVLRREPATSYLEFVESLERRDASSPDMGDLGIASRSVGPLLAGAAVAAPPRAEWPARPELLRHRRALNVWCARLHREAAARAPAWPSRRLAMTMALVIVLAGAALGFLHRRPVWRVVYFRTTSLTDPAASDLTANIGFNWGNASPHRDVPEDFSARWETCMVLDRHHSFEFVLGSDDGARLFVDDQVVIDQWKDQEYTEHSASIGLGAGKHAVRVEHFDSQGAAELTLRARIDGKGEPRSIPRSLLRAPGRGAGPCD
jgi:PA14 domain